jgi:hypothetical protein
MINFANPLFLWGLFAISIPVLIHLFNFRKFKKEYFTNVSFLEELKFQTQKYSRLKHLLVLILRILAITSIVLAFSRPFIPKSNSFSNLKGRNIISIYIDNSFSMEAIYNQSHLFDIAKNKALEIIDAYSNSDWFHLVTNDFEGKHQHLLSKEQFKTMLKDVQISPNYRNISEILKRQEDIFSLEKQSNKQAFIISDFQKSTSDFEKLKSDTTVHIYLVPLKSQKRNNIYIDSCWLDKPVFRVNSNVTVFVRIKNNSDESYEKVPLKLVVNEKQRAISSFNIQPDEEISVPVTFRINETGIHNAFFEIVDYPVVYDDKLYFSFNVVDRIPVLIINGNQPNNFLNKVFQLDTSFYVENVNQSQINYTAFSKHNLIVLNELNSISTGLAGEIKKYLQQGGNLLLIPSKNIDYQSYNMLADNINTLKFNYIDSNSISVDKINFHHIVYRNVFEKNDQNIDLPKVFKYYKLYSSSLIRKDNLLQLINGNDFLAETQSYNGKVFISSVPFDPQWTNFPRHPVFVPTLLNIAMLDNFQNNLYNIIGKDFTFNIKQIEMSKDDVFKIKNDNDFEFIPQHRIYENQISFNTQNQILKADNYNLMYNNKNITGLSFNYNRAESKLDFYIAEDISNIIKSSNLRNCNLLSSNNKTLGEAIKELNSGLQLWKLFVVLSLFFFLMEIIVIRFWK